MKPTIEIIPQRPVVCSDRSTTLSVLVRAQAPRAEMVKKPSLNIGICIDCSGSMGGDPLRRAKEAACHLLGKLAVRDVISLVSFANQSDVLVPSREVWLAAHSVTRRLASLCATGGTALHEGWLESSCQVKKAARKGRLSRVLMLSDGVANVGLSDPTRIGFEVAELARCGVSTTTIGLGEGYNEDLLSEMARCGQGNFHHVRSSKDIMSAFQLEMYGLFSTLGSGVSFGIKAKDGAELIRVVNPIEPTPQGRFNMADLAYGHQVELVLEFLLPASSQTREVCEVNFRWTDVHTGEQYEISEVLRLPVVPHGQLCEFPLSALVMQKRALQEAACLMRDSAALMDGYSYSQAEGKLKEARSLLEQVEQTREVVIALKQLHQLLVDLKEGQTSLARKQASSYCFSSGSGSIAFTPGLKEFIALPEDQRTPEKFRELMERASTNGSS